MSEFLIRIRDKTAQDFYINAIIFKRGDVLDACPDGWKWGSYELTDPDHRIVRINIPLAEARAFCSPEIMSDQTKQSEKTLKWRGFTLDIDNPTIPVALRNWLNDDTRAVPILNLGSVLTLNSFRALKKAKAITADPEKVHG